MLTGRGLLTGGVTCLALAAGAVQLEQSRSHAGAVHAFRAAPPAQTKIALIVAIGTYEPSTDWHPLATSNDEKAIRGALKRQGFQDADIRTVTDGSARAPEIVNAFRESLIKRATPGAVAVFHFSGHGHRLTDDNGDEPDGYDEVLVPYDAPRRPKQDYKGERHIRDDQLNELVRELRLAVGPHGDVIVSLDSCYSGSAARSPMATAQARGEITPIGPPQGGLRGVDVLGGFDETVPTQNASPYVVLSASGHGERAWETSDTDGTAIGSLSLALSRSLHAAGATTTYRALFDDVRRRMAAVVVNTPQIEGVQDRAILGGAAITQEAFYTIHAFDPPASRARLTHGSLSGLFDGTRVTVHPPGTAVPDPANALATGTVLATPTEAIIDLKNIVDPAQIATGWVFVTQQSFGTLRAAVKVESIPNAIWVDPVTRALTSQRFVSVAERSPDYLVTQDPKPPSQVYLRAASDARVLVGPFDPADPKMAEQIARRVKFSTYNRYLRSLSMRAPGIDAAVEIKPCELSCVGTGVGQRCDCLKDLDERLFRSSGGDVMLAVGEGFRFRLRNPGPEPVYVSVLDLLPDGDVRLMWPDVNHSGDDNRLPPGADFTIARPWRVAPPIGLEVFTMIASREQVDFRPIVSNGFHAVGSRGPLDNLFVNAFEGTRAEPTVPVSAVHTHGIIVRIVEKRSP